MVTHSALIDALRGVVAEDPQLLAVIDDHLTSEGSCLYFMSPQLGTIHPKSKTRKKVGAKQQTDGAEMPVLDGSFFALTQRVSRLATENAALELALTHAREDAVAYAEVARELEELCKAKNEEAQLCAKSAGDALARLTVAEATIEELKVQFTLEVMSLKNALATSISPIQSMPTLHSNALCQKLFGRSKSEHIHSDAAQSTIEELKAQCAPEVTSLNAAETTSIWPMPAPSESRASRQRPALAPIQRYGHTRTRDTAPQNQPHCHQTMDSATMPRSISTHKFELAMWQRSAEKKLATKKTHLGPQFKQNIHAITSAPAASKDQRLRLVCTSSLIQGAEKLDKPTPSVHSDPCLITHSLCTVLYVLLLEWALMVMHFYCFET
jgi:hypothetical protein